MRGVTQSLARGAEGATPDTHASDLEQVLDQRGEAVIIKDLNAVVTYWNREARRCTVFPRRKPSCIRNMAPSRRICSRQRTRRSTGPNTRVGTGFASPRNRRQLAPDQASVRRQSPARGRRF
jgi:hypothetical protein